MDVWPEIHVELELVFPQAQQLFHVLVQLDMVVMGVLVSFIFFFSSFFPFFFKFLVWNDYYFIIIQDLNECTLGTHNCHAQATCTNTIGSFNCACKSGYSGNGVSCTGIFFFFF